MKTNTRVRVKTTGRFAIITDIRPFEQVSQAYIRYCDSPFENDVKLTSDLTEYDPGTNSIC